MRSTQRRLVYQALLLLLAGAAVLWVFETTQSNLERLGVHSGFDFLFLEAGFEIGQAVLDFGPNSPIYVALVVAFLNTLLLAAVSILLATTIGFIVGLSRLSRNWLLSRLAFVYVETFRNVPALLQIFFWYFVVLSALPDVEQAYEFLASAYLSNRGLSLPAPLPREHFWAVLAALAAIVIAYPVLARSLQLKSDGRRRLQIARHACRLIAFVAVVVLAWRAIDLLSWDIPRPGRFGPVGGMSLSPEFVALAFGLAIYNATYIAEIVRSAFQSVPPGLSEAAEALGLRRWQTLRTILFPLAARAIVPPLTGNYVNIFKSTSLAAAIAYPDVMSVFVGTVNNLVGQPLEIMAVTFLMYAGVSFATAVLMHWYAHRLRRG